MDETSGEEPEVVGIDGGVGEQRETGGLGEGREGGVGRNGEVAGEGERRGRRGDGRAYLPEEEVLSASGATVVAGTGVSLGSPAGGM